MRLANRSVLWPAEEADSRIILHYYKPAGHQKFSTDNAYHCHDSDTYLLVLLVSYASTSLNLFTWTRGSGNKRRMVDIKAIADDVGLDICAALPANHAFTGCDYICAFVRKGKVKPLELLRKQSDILTLFKEQGSTQSAQKIHLPALERFVCALYGQPQCNSTNMVRYKRFRHVTSYKAATNVSPFLTVLISACSHHAEVH